MSTGIMPDREALPPRRSRVGAYGLWQLRDYLMDRGAPTFIVACLFGYVTLAPLLASMATTKGTTRGMLARYGSVAAAEVAKRQELNYLFLRGFLGALVFLGALFAMNGIVANDRKLGFYRFLFAKPVTPARYYGQAFVIHWVGFLFVMTVLGTLYGFLVAPVLSWRLIGVVGLMFACYAGIAFALSAAARWDWLSLVSVSFAATYFWGRYGESTHPLATLLYLLPPLHRTDQVYGSLAGLQLAGTERPPFPWTDVWWLAGYGATAFVIGLVVLRHRRLAII
jgi:hypothetical protein